MDTIKSMEHYFRDMQDMEYTIEKGKLYFLQTRNGKRTARAALKIACDLVDEGLITEKEAVCRVEPKQLNDLLHPGTAGKHAGNAAVVHGLFHLARRVDHGGFRLLVERLALLRQRLDRVLRFFHARGHGADAGLEHLLQFIADLIHVDRSFQS